ncbi:MAG: PAS-domain containing protein [Pseudomonadota bacterium]
MGVTLTIITLAGYVGLLFAAAAWGDARAAAMDRRPMRRAWLYMLGLGVYCTSWTFYGAVGEATRNGWDYLPIYLGPALIFLIGFSIVRRMVRLGRQHDTASIADFLSARYGKSAGVAALAALVLLISALPYIALQLKSAATSLTLLTGQAAPAGLDAAALAAAAFAAFAILFGQRRADAAQGNRGLVLAVAIESAVKIAAMAAVGAFALWIWLSLPEAERSAAPAAARLAQPGFDFRFIMLTVLAGTAALCLPRQFHMMVVEARRPGDVVFSRFAFPAYLLAVALVAPPVALAGSAMLGGADPDAFVLALPISQGAEGLALFAFIGGFSAAAGMVTIASLALSTMLVNDLVGPFFLRRALERGGPDLAQRLLNLRRGAVLVLVFAAWVFHQGLNAQLGLADIGLVSFAGVAQLAPGLLFGLYWRRASRLGAVAGLCTGFTAWLATILVPAYGGFTLAAPLGLDPLAFFSALSLVLNALALVVGSAFARTGLIDQIQARAFTSLSGDAKPASPAAPGARIADLTMLLDRVIGASAASATVSAIATQLGRALGPGDPLTPAAAGLAEARLARAVGASSARVLMTRVLPGGRVSPHDVVTLLDETAEKIRFSEDVLRATLEHLHMGVSVVDKDLRLAAWNSTYVNLFDYPPDMVRVGRPIADLIAWNAERGECGRGPVEAHVEKRLTHMRAGSAHAYERVRRDGTVLEILGRAMPGGGYVTSYADITDRKSAEAALAESERAIRFYTDNLPALLSYADRGYRLQFANQGYLDFFGLDRDALGQPLKDLMNKNDYALRQPHMEAALNGERRIFDITRTEPDGRRQVWQVTYQPRFEAGEPVGFFGAYQDVTGRRDAEEGLKRAYATLEDQVDARTAELKAESEARLALAEDLEAARQAAEAATASKTRFLAAASHDLLQPLAAARLLTSALEHELETGSPDARSLASRIDRSIENADRLLRALLDISRLDADGVTPQPGVFHLGELMEDAAAQFASRAEARGLSLRVAPTRMAVFSDRGLMTSILQNLVSNAVRYTETGAILIGARRAGDAVRLQVIDTGHGIAPEDQARIFREFERAGSKQKVEAEGGLGLGLAIVDRIARRLGHKLSLRSQPGQGSVFEISLPRASSGPKPRRARRRTASLEGLKVLCLDNEPPVLDAIVSLLQRWGCQAEGAHDRHAAALAFEGAPPDIVVLDYQLDDGDTGPEALAALSESWGVRPPGVLATAERGEAVGQAARAAGLELLHKPVAPAALRAAIAALKRRSA